MGEKEKYLIVLEKVPFDRQPEAALFLSGCFSLPPASTRGIAASGPIALLANLTKAQADAIFEELSASAPAEVVLRVTDEGESAKFSRLQWPRPPRIYGRDLSEFEIRPESQELHCPICGGILKIFKDSSGMRALAAHEHGRKAETSRRYLTPSDKDPLFSGVKPLASADSNFASLRSLDAGDTGFWMDYSNPYGASPQDSPASRTPGYESSSVAKKTSAKLSAGLSAFMKPGGFALVMGRTKDPQAVKMVSEIMGVNEEEARDKCLNLGLCVAKNISLDEAQNLLARFRKLGARARIVRPT